MQTKSPAYSMRVFWSEEDGGFIAVCPELKHVSAFGESYAAAFKELEIAIEGAVEIHMKEGWPLPAPAVENEHSGQLRLRMPRSLHARLAGEADRDGVSLNTLIVAKLSEASGADAAARMATAAMRKELSRFRSQTISTSSRSRIPRRA
jgi:predicted RNase H-like HicB family nuclease